LARLQGLGYVDALLSAGEVGVMGHTVDVHNIFPTM